MEEQGTKEAASWQPMAEGLTPGVGSPTSQVPDRAGDGPSVPIYLILSFSHARRAKAPAHSTWNGRKW